MLGILAALIFAGSLCADCFAVSACSSVTLRDVSFRRVFPVALVFAVVQTGFLLAGWGFGDLFISFVGKLAPWIGFLLLVYVGGSMLLSAWKNEPEKRNLDGIVNLLIGAVATSLDAFAVGISLSMDGESFGDLSLKAAAVFLVTFLSVVLGMKGGSYAGRRYGRSALVIGGIVLITIGLNILFDFI